MTISEAHSAGAEHGARLEQCTSHVVVLRVRRPTPTTLTSSYLRTRGPARRLCDLKRHGWLDLRSGLPRS